MAVILSSTMKSLTIPHRMGVIPLSRYPHCIHYLTIAVCCLVTLSCPTLLQSHGLQPTRLWNSPGKNSGAACHFLLQEIFPTQEVNLHLFLCLLQWQADSLPLSHGEALLAHQKRKNRNVYIHDLVLSTVSGWTIHWRSWISHGEGGTTVLTFLQLNLELVTHRSIQHLFFLHTSHIENTVSSHHF